MFQIGYSKTQGKMSGIEVFFFFFKAVLVILTRSQFIKQFTELLHNIIFLKNKCSFVTINIKQ